VADVEARQRLRSSSFSSLIVSRTRLSTSVSELFRLPLLASEQSAWSCHFRTFRTCLLVSAQNSPVNISYPSPLWLYSARAVTLSCFRHYNRSCLLTYVLIWKCPALVSRWYVIRFRWMCYGYDECEHVRCCEKKQPTDTEWWSLWRTTSRTQPWAHIHACYPSYVTTSTSTKVALAESWLYYDHWL